jgi:PAS domain S-box-containing protein
VPERKQTETSAGDSRKLLDNLLQAASNFSIVATDPYGIITVFNRGAELMLDYAADEVVGIQSVLFLHLDSEITARETELTTEIGYPIKGFQVFAAKPKLEGSETRDWSYVRKDGSVFPVSLVVTAIRSDEGEIIGYLGIANDISKRMRAEKEIKTLAAIVRHSSELVNLVDPEGKMVFLNEAGSKILGINPDNIIKTNIVQVIHYPMKDFVKNELLPSVLSGQTWEGNLQFIDLRTGAVFDMHTIAFSIDDPHTPDKKYMANISLDITRLKQTEEKFEKVFMMAPDMITITRMADGLIMDVNLGFEALTGWKRDEVIGHTSYDLNFWIDQADRALMVDELKAGKDIIRREIPFRHKDGSLRTGIYSARFIQIAGEYCLVFVMQDITERKKTEKILKESEKRLRSITSHMPGVMYQFYVADSGEMAVSYASERMPEILGLSPAHVNLFQEFCSHIHEKDRERFLASIKKAVDRYAHWNFEGRFVKPSGETLWINSLSTPTRHKDRMVFDGIILDITRRKQAEEMSRLSEEKFSKVFLTTPNCIAITRMKDGQFMDINPGFEESSGWKAHEIRGRTSLDINFWVNPAERDLMVEELKAGRDVLYKEFQFRSKDGNVRTGVYSARSINIADEPCLIFIMQDITDQKRP